MVEHELPKLGTRVRFPSRSSRLMNSHRVRRSVADHTPLDKAEERSVEVFLTHFDDLEDPFDEHGDLIHVTGSAIVIGRRGVVLLKHKRLGIWLQPGGPIDPGETPWQAALREAAEETGLELSFAAVDSEGVPSLAHVDVHPAARGHTHLDLRYLVSGSNADPTPPPGESQEIGWFSWADAAERADDDRLAALITHLGGIHGGK